MVSVNDVLVSDASTEMTHNMGQPGVIEVLRVYRVRRMMTSKEFNAATDKIQVEDFYANGPTHVLRIYFRVLRDRSIRCVEKCCDSDTALQQKDYLSDLFATIDWKILGSWLVQQP